MRWLNNGNLVLTCYMDQGGVGYFLKAVELSQSLLMAFSGLFWSTAYASIPFGLLGSREQRESSKGAFKFRLDTVL